MLVAVIIIVVIIIIITERLADNSSHSQATLDQGRPRKVAQRAPGLRSGPLAALLQNACSIIYSTILAHTHLNWANSTSCVCCGEERESHLLKLLATALLRRQMSPLRVDETQTWPSLTISASTCFPCVCISAG